MKTYFNMFKVNKNITFRYIISLLMCLCILLVFISINLRQHCRSLILKNNSKYGFLRFIYGDAPYLITKQNGDVFQNKDMKWDVIYPFADLVNGNEKSKNKLMDKIKRIPRKMSDEVRRTKRYYNSMVPFKFFILYCFNALEDFLGWNIANISEYNPVLELEKNYFVGTEKKKDISELINSLNELYSFCKKQNTELLLVMAPPKVSREDSTGIVGTADFSNDNLDRLYKGLKDTCINYIDMRDELEKENLVLHDLFFQTDLHWKPETALWASKIIIERLSKILNKDLKIDNLDPKLYKSVVYKNWFLGSQGKKVTLLRAKPESISLLYPTFFNQIRFQIPSINLDKTGDFSISYNVSKIQKKDYMIEDPYDVYCYGIRDLIKFTNYESPNKIKVLLVKDSFGNTAAPFLAMSVSDLTLIDLRNFYGSLQAYIKSNRPDVVVVLYSSLSICKIKEDKHNTLCDFR